jgi:hypothetical protein
MGKASRGASGNNRQSARHAINVIVSHDFSFCRLDSVMIVGARRTCLIAAGLRLFFLNLLSWEQIHETHSSSSSWVSGHRAPAIRFGCLTFTSFDRRHRFGNG